MMPLKFTPLEFETLPARYKFNPFYVLKFTPLEFETVNDFEPCRQYCVKIYSVGV